MAGEIKIRLERGDASAELSGDAAAVQAVLADLKSNGVGALAFLFGASSPSLSAGSPAAPVSVGGPPAASARVTPAVGLRHPAASFRFVIDAMKLPTRAGEFAVDVDGDGRSENVFGNVIAALAGQSIDFQGGLDAQLKASATGALITVLTETATAAPDQAASVRLLTGKTLDASQRAYAPVAGLAVTTLEGRIAGGRFQSDSPRNGGAVVNRAIDLPIGPNASPLPVQGLQIAFDIAADGSTLSNGHLTGSIRQADIEAVWLPAVAEVLLNAVQGNSAIAHPLTQLLSITATSTQAEVTAALAKNPLFRSLLQPDVQIWDLTGAYGPNPLHGMPDSLSFGIGFSAARASY